MKLTASQLRRIIKEEIKKVASGKKTLSELYDSQTSWVDAVRKDDRTVGELLDAYDDMTKTLVGVSSSAFQDLMPYEELTISEIEELEDATVVDSVEALIGELSELAADIDAEYGRAL